MRPARVVLPLAELVLAAHRAGVALPFAPIAQGAAAAPTGDRMSARLAGTPPGRAHEVVAAELARVDDTGPDGAAAGLARRGLLDGAGLDPRLATVLGALTTAPLVAALDVAVTGDGGTESVRGWWAAGDGVLSGLVLRGPVAAELVSAPVTAWSAELARLVVGPAEVVTSQRTSLPVEALLGALAVQRRGRPDLVEAVATDHGVRDALPLLHALARCRGRLRLLVVRRRRPESPGVTVWVLLDDGWRSLRPLPDARVEVAGRRPVELGLASYPWVRAAA